MAKAHRDSLVSPEIRTILEENYSMDQVEEMLVNGTVPICIIREAIHWSKFGEVLLGVRYQERLGKPDFDICRIVGGKVVHNCLRNPDIAYPIIY